MKTKENGGGGQLSSSYFFFPSFVQVDSVKPVDSASFLQKKGSLPAIIVSFIPVFQKVYFILIEWLSRQKMTGLPKLLVEGRTKENTDKLLILCGNIYRIEIPQVPCNK